MIALALLLLAAEPPLMPVPEVQVNPLGEFRHLSFGPFFSAELGTSTAGYDLAGNLGLQSFRLTSSEHTYLLGWDLQLALRAGGLANTHTNQFFIGATGQGAVDLHHRLRAQSHWSPVVGAGVGAGLLVLGSPGTPLSQLSTINSVDGYGGVVPFGTVRAGVGLSWLKGQRAFLIEVLFQELLRGSGVVAPFAAFSEGGLSARLDFAGNFSAIVEAFYGVTPDAGISGLQAHYQSRRIELDVKVRKTFANRWWVGALFELSQEGAITTYEVSKTQFVSTQAPVFRFGLAVGLPIGGEP